MKHVIIKYFLFFDLTPTRVTTLVTLSIIAAFFEGFSMAMLLPVLEFIEKGKDVALLEQAGGMWPIIISVLNYVGLLLTFQALLIAALVVMLIRVVVVYAMQAYNAWLSNEVRHKVRTRLYDSYMGMNYGAYTDLSSGKVLNLLTTESWRAGGSFSSLFSIVSNSAVLIGFTITMFWLSVPLTLYAITFLGVAAAMVAYFVRHTRNFSYQSTKANEHYSFLVLERLNAFRLIKLTATGNREMGIVHNASREMSSLMYWLSKMVLRVDLVMEPLILLGGFVILYLSINVLGLSISEVSIFGLILLRSIPITKGCIKAQQAFYSCLGSIDAVINGYDKALPMRERKGGDNSFNGLKIGIRLDNVVFAYEEAGRPALSDITFTIPAGKITAIAGPSGAGKSTLADIIARLRVPQEGDIFYDNLEGSEYDLSSLRRGIAFVSQDATILNDTVAENLRFANFEATDEEIWEVLEKAKARKFVESLTGGLCASLGEHGIKLSGGQKQRLSLARALLQKASLLILDEPTSNLDSETEREIKQVIDELRCIGEATILIIAHRFSTIIDADKIVVLENGRIIEQGSHEKLMLSDKWYARISSMQSAVVSQ